MAIWSLELSTGAEYHLDAANGVKVKGAFGHLMPPIDNIDTNYALVDGALHQRSAVRPRILTLLCTVTGTSVATLFAYMKALVTASNPHRPNMPVKIWYRSGAAGTGMYINGYYEGGLEGGQYKGYSELNVPLRFKCVDPFWYYETAIAAQALDVYDSMAVANYIIERDADGAWTSMHDGADGAVSCLAVAANGDVYAGGAFHNIGGVACAHIARWDVATSHWFALGAGADAAVLALAFTANGDLYVGGQFTNAGGGAAAYIAKYVHTTTTWSAVGAGLSGAVQNIVTAPNGDVFVGGIFHDVGGGGITVNHVARWTAAGAWAAMGATGTDDDVDALAVAPNGDLYVGGEFHNAGGVACAHIAKWDGTTWTPLGAGTNSLVADLTVGLNGDLYAVGTFTTAGVITVSYSAKWNGSAWSSLGTGTNTSPLRISTSWNGDIYASGSFTTAGGISCPGHWAIWANGVWLPGWTGTLGAGISAFVIEEDRTILAGSFVAAATPGVTTIDNTGSANGYPVIAITGPGRLLYLINYDTEQVIYIDITLVASEVLTIDFRRATRGITSSFRGNMIHGVLAGTLTNWFLQPGENHIGCYVDDATAAAVYGYSKTYWGAE